jgi:hypothetical protein
MDAILIDHEYRHRPRERHSEGGCVRVAPRFARCTDLARFSARRARTILLTSVLDSSRSGVKRMVPLDVL